MKIILLLSVLAIASQGFLVLPHGHMELKDVRAMYSGFLEGVGLIHDGYELGSGCMGYTTAMYLYKISEAASRVFLHGEFSQAIPLFQMSYSLLLEMQRDCQFSLLFEHIFTHSELKSLREVPFHLISEKEHILGALAAVQHNFWMMKYGEFQPIGQALGGLIGHTLKLAGAEMSEPISM